MLTPIDLNINQQYRISRGKPPAGAVCYEIGTPEKTAAALDAFAAAAGTANSAAAGSLFVKRYCTLIAGAVCAYLYDGVALNLRPDNIRLELAGSMLRFHLETPELPLAETGHTAPDGKERTRLYAAHLYANNVAPLFELVSKLTGIQEATLWSTLSYLLAYWKNEWLQALPSGEAPETFLAAFEQLTVKADRRCFPGRSRNPLTAEFATFVVPDEPDRSFLLRQKCCLNYCSGSGQYCYTCPRLTDEERLKRYKEVHGH